MWPWKVWVRDNGIGRPDEGIGIVAEEKNGDHCAIQCKCYADGGSRDLKALSTFMTAADTQIRAGTSGLFFRRHGTGV